MSVININGNRIEVVDGSNITINNGSIVVNGRNIYSGTQSITVQIQGDVNNIKSDGSVSVTGNVLGSVDAGNSVRANDIGGDVDAGNSVHASNISGKCDAGNSIYKK